MGANVEAAKLWVGAVNLCKVIAENPTMGLADGGAGTDLRLAVIGLDVSLRMINARRTRAVLESFSSAGSSLLGRGERTRRERARV